MPRAASERERRCVVTREVRPTGQLIRFVASPEGQAVPDLRHRLPGRGAWVSADRGTLERAIRGRALQKSLELPEPVPPALADQVEALLQAAARGGLSLARKAGLAVSGFTKVQSVASSGRAVALIHAAEASEDGARKLQAAAKRNDGKALPTIGYFTREDLDLAFGGTNVIHAALLRGPASDNVLEKVQVLARYRGENGPLGQPQSEDECGTRSADVSQGY